MLDVNFRESLGLATADEFASGSHLMRNRYHQLPPTQAERDDCSEKRSGPNGTGVLLRKYKRVASKALSVIAGREVTRSRYPRAMGTLSSQPVTNIWYLRAPVAPGYLLTLLEGLEGIYFAAYIKSVDEESGIGTCPRRGKIDVERKQIEGRRDSDIENRMRKLEEDTAALEAEGAKADAKRKVREGAEREVKQLRDRAQRELDRLEAVWNRFKNLKVQDLEGDEVLYRNENRFRKYFSVSMCADAIISA